MAEQGGQDRTEQATPKRREEAREKGNVAKSTELNSAVVLLAALMIFKLIAGYFSEVLETFLMRTYHEIAFIEISVENFPSQVLYILKIALALTGPVLLTVLIAGVGINYAQIGVVFAKKAMIPDFKKLNPLNGIKRLFSARSLVELLKGLLKIGIVALIAYMVVRSHVDDYIMLTHRTLQEIVAFLVSVLTDLTLKVGFALLVMAAADYAYQRWEYEKT